MLFKNIKLHEIFGTFHKPQDYMELYHCLGVVSLPWQCMSLNLGSRAFERALKEGVFLSYYIYFSNSLFNKSVIKLQLLLPTYSFKSKVI